MSLITNQFRNTPVLETTVRKVASDDKWYFALRKFLDGDLKSVRLTIKGNKYGGVHTVQKSRYVQDSAKDEMAHLIWRALVPSMRARSYFVK